MRVWGGSFPLPVNITLVVHLDCRFWPGTPHYCECKAAYRSSEGSVTGATFNTDNTELEQLPVSFASTSSEVD